MKNYVIVSALALGLAACGGGGEEAVVEEEAAPAETFLPGNFVIRTEVTALDSVDDGEPATSSGMGDTREIQVCVGEDGLLPAAAFGEDGDDCTIENPYQRKGRLRQQLVCNRSAGQVNLQVEADFTAEGVDGTVRSGSAFAGEGDYQMTRTITGERTGDCTPAEAEGDLDTDVEG
ncbi:DUF3617 family protein [Sphingomicrobium sp. XHP0235]|uniref:DUF3617 domain-containing protein n=1 Tax=Sphingomicrobium aquimarinum TaxID=3133971 RepID=UPI0031FEA524